MNVVSAGGRGAVCECGVCWWSGCRALGSRARIIGSAWHWGRIWGIGVGNDALGQVINMPQCGLTCPNRANLPQCGLTCPNTRSRGLVGYRTRTDEGHRCVASASLSRARRCVGAFAGAVGWCQRGCCWWAGRRRICGGGWSVSAGLLLMAGPSARLRGWLVGVTGVAADGRAVGASAGVAGARASAPMTVTDRFRIPTLSWAHPIWRVWIHQRDVLPVDATGWPESPRVRMGADSRRPCGLGLGAVPLEGPRERASRAHGDG